MPQCQNYTMNVRHFAQRSTWQVEVDAPPLVALDLSSAGSQRPGMRLYPSDKKRVSLPMGDAVVAVDYELAAVLLYDGGHYACILRGEAEDEPAWVRYDGMSTDGGLKGVGSKCMPPDGASS